MLPRALSLPIPPCAPAGLVTMLSPSGSQLHASVSSPGLSGALQVQQQGKQNDARRSSTAERLRTVLKIITFSVAKMTEVASGGKEDRKKILVELVKNFLAFSMSTSQNEAAREKGAISASLLI